MIAEGKIGWAFLPPVSDTSTISNLDGQGIWIPREDADLDESESDASVHKDESDGQSDADGPSPTLVSEASDEEGPVGGKKPAAVSFTGGRFALLNVGADDEDDEESDGKDEAEDEEDLHGGE